MNVLSKPLPMSCWVNVRVYLMEKTHWVAQGVPALHADFQRSLCRNSFDPETHQSRSTSMVVTGPYVQNFWLRPHQVQHSTSQEFQEFHHFFCNSFSPPLQKFPRSFGPHSTTPLPSPPFSNPLHLLRPPTGAGSFTDREAFRD